MIFFFFDSFGQGLDLGQEIVVEGDYMGGEGVSLFFGEHGVVVVQDGGGKLR